MLICTFTEFAKVFGYGVFTGMLLLVAGVFIYAHFNDKRRKP